MFFFDKRWLCSKVTQGPDSCINGRAEMQEVWFCFCANWILEDNSLSKGYLFFSEFFFFLLCFLFLSRILGFCFYQKRVCFWSSPDFLTNDFFLHKIKESSGSFFCQKKVTKQTLFCMVKVLFVFLVPMSLSHVFFSPLLNLETSVDQQKRQNFFQQNIVCWGKILERRLRTGHGLGLVRARVEA